MHPVRRKKETRANIGRKHLIKFPFNSRLSLTFPPPLTPPTRGGEFFVENPDPFLPLDGGGEVRVELLGRIR
jgi:hypothetical protein